MVKLTLDGKATEALEGTTILKVAKEMGIDIPTLCHHEAVEDYGGCRLCVVEVQQKGRSRIVASCLYPAEEGLTVLTNSPRVMNTRRTVMELLLARCPNNKPMQEFAAEKFGIKDVPFPLEDSHCIVCGLCARVCKEVVGVSAISLVSRGVKREPASPFYDLAEDCIGCGSCVYICPTKVIQMEDVGDTRRIPMWKTEFKLKKCKVCGNYFAPEKQLEYIRTKWNLPEGFFDTCPNCK